MKDMRSISLAVNGVRHEVEVETRLTLADCLRHRLGLTGTHLGCEHAYAAPAPCSSTAACVAA